MTASALDFASSPVFFEAKYEKSSDPWNFALDPYELSRYEAIVRAISHRHYCRAFEPGCSLGILTERLAAHCDQVYACDFSALAARQAQARCAHLPHVTVHCEALSARLPFAGCELLLLSEIGYYFEGQEWSRMCEAFVETLPSGATILAAHWLGHSEDHRISGDEVHQTLLSLPELQAEHGERTQCMRLDRLVRR